MGARVGAEEEVEDGCVVGLGKTGGEERGGGRGTMDGEDDERDGVSGVMGSGFCFVLVCFINFFNI